MTNKEENIMTMEELRERYARFCEENEEMEREQANREFANEVAPSIEEWFTLIALLED